MKALLFCGLMYQDQGGYEKAIAILQKRFGKSDCTGEEYSFDFTDSYLKEFGPNLKKRFVVFKKIIGRKELPSIKIWCCSIEKKLGKEGKRRVNIDPGYITPNNIVVASTKEFPHRIYLDKGIFGDVQLVLKREEAIGFEHTFADYIKQKDFFLQQRTKAPRWQI